MCKELSELLVQLRSLLGVCVCADVPRADIMEAVEDILYDLDTGPATRPPSSDDDMQEEEHITDVKRRKSGPGPSAGSSST